MTDKLEQQLGPVLGYGAQATVYGKDGYAVKLYRKGYPKLNVFSEAIMMANLEAVGFPSPKVYEVLLIDGQYGLRMDQIKGEPMMRAEGIPDMEPEVFQPLINELVDLQVKWQRNHEIAQWAVPTRARLQSDLHRSQALSDALRAKLLGMLEELPDGEALNHGDFHGGNVFFDGKDYTVIDLLQISKGDPAADALMSYASYYLSSPEIADYYLNRYSEVSGIPKADIMRWRPVFAGTMLDAVPEKFQPAVRELLGEELLALNEQ
ncbi:MAG: aminoglycoside phosphotransferase family protein [Promicromonosporaceae bacterium]|nr:aminoglycoside phosphotransferase family protein [Promicromonosporaceae bacterium]